MRVLLAVAGSLLFLSCGGGTTPPSPVTPVAPTPSPTTFTVSGTVSDDSGRPVASALVSVGRRLSKTGPGFAVTTDSSGFFRGGLPPGEYLLGVSKDGFHEIAGREVVVEGDLRLDVTLVPGVIVGGIVSETGVGPLGGATVSAFRGSELKLSTTTGPGVPGSYSLQYLQPGTYTLRVSKSGYDTQEKTVEALIDTRLNFEMKWSYGACLRSVSPVNLDSYASGGGTSTISVDANPGKAWTATPNVPWVRIVSPASRAGSGQLEFRVDANPLGAIVPRKGAVMIRCSPEEGQNVWISQLPDCRVRLEPGPELLTKFPAVGGIGHLQVQLGIPNCEWRASSLVDWMTTVGINSWPGELPGGLDLAFVIRANSTGIERTGAMLVNETTWSVTQLP